MIRTQRQVMAGVAEGIALAVEAFVMEGRPFADLGHAAYRVENSERVVSVSLQNGPFFVCRSTRFVQDRAGHRDLAEIMQVAGRPHQRLLTRSQVHPLRQSHGGGRYARRMRARPRA